VFVHDPNAPPPPRVTCPDCGLEYADDSDWSGDAHAERHCIAHLKKRLAEAQAVIVGAVNELDDRSETIARLMAERDELASRGHFHDEPCYFCKKPINSFAANPGLWGVPLCHAEEPGKVKAHHIDCVHDRLSERDAWLAAAFEIACDSPDLLAERLLRLVKELAEAKEETQAVVRSMNTAVGNERARADSAEKARDGMREHFAQLAESQAPDVADDTTDEYRRGQKRGALSAAAVIRGYDGSRKLF